MEVLEQLIALLPTVILGGVGVSLVTELLKIDAIPIPVQKYPRISSFILSLISSFISLVTAGMDLSDDITTIILDIVFTFLVAFIFYKTILKKVMNKNKPDGNQPPEIQ